MPDVGSTNWPLDTDDLNLPSDMDTRAPTSAGDGHYTLKQWYERVTGMLRSTAHDLLTAMTHDVAMGGFKITGLPVPTATTEPVIKSQIDTDAALAANSDVKVPSQKAVKAYADALIAAADAMVFKGVIDCSANPNYPAADRGWTYRVSVAGKIGGASGTVVEAGDLLICLTDGTASGTQAAVGAQWTIAQANIDGAVTGPASSTDGDFAQFNGAGGKVVKDGGISLDTDTALAANSDTRLASQKATKAYAAAQAAAAQAASQPLDSDLTAIAALSTAVYGRSLLTLGGHQLSPSQLGIAPTGHWRADSEIAYADGDPVGTFTDRSGNGRTLSASTTARPTYKAAVAGSLLLPALRFDGSANVMTTGVALSSFITSAAETVFAVVSVTTFNQGGAIGSADSFSAIVADSSSYWELAPSSTGPVIASAQYTSGNIGTSVSAAAGTWYIIEARHQAGTRYVSLNGGAAGSVSAGNIDVVTGLFKMGSNWNDAHFFNGDIAEVAVFTIALSATDRAAVRRWLGAKYGIATA